MELEDLKKYAEERSNSLRNELNGIVKYVNDFEKEIEEKLKEVKDNEILKAVLTLGRRLDAIEKKLSDDEEETAARPATSIKR